MEPSLQIKLNNPHSPAVVSDRLPADARYDVPYSQKQSWRGDDWWICWQTYDARHAYVYLIEVFTKRPLQFEVECLRRDLRWLYPLSGAFSIADKAGGEVLKLTADEHIRVLSGPRSQDRKSVV